MASTAELLVRVLTDTTKAVSGINDVGNTATKQQSKFRRLGGVIAGALSVGAVVAFGKASVEAAASDAEAQAQLAAALKNTTGATDSQVAKSEEYIASLSQQTALADDELRPALATLARGFGDTEKAQLALATATDIAAATGKPLATVTEAMAKAARGNTGALGKMGIATKDASGEALTLDEIMANAAATFSGQAAVAAESTAGQMRNAQNAMGEMSEQVGTALLPVVGELATVLTDNVVPALSTVFTFITDNIQWLAPLAAGILAIVVAVKLWNVVQLALNSTLLANPIFWVVAAVVALIAVGVLLVKNWDKIVAWLKKLWDGIKKAATTVFNAIKDAIAKVWKSIKDTVANIWNGIKDTITGVWNAIKDAVATAVGWVKDKVGGAFRGVSDIIKTIWNGIVDYFRTMIDIWLSIFQGAWDFFQRFVDFLGTIGDAIAETWEGVTGTIEVVWNNVVDGLKSAVNFFIDGINKIIGAINSGIGWINKLPGPNIGTIPLIPRLAAGGVLTQPTLFVGGERGTEIVTPERLLRSILRQEGGGGGYTLNIYPRKADASDVAWGFRRLELARTGR